MLSNSTTRKLGGINDQEVISLHEVQFQSYSNMREALVGMGVNSATVDMLSLPALTAVLEFLRNQSLAKTPSRVRGRPRGRIPQENLSNLDKKILKALLSSTGTVSSATLSKELDIPLSTVHRRRGWLESNLLNRSYTLKAEMLGMRTAELFISTRNGTTSAVARTLLELRDTVFTVWRTISESGIDLEARVIFRNYEQLANILERINSIDGVDKVCWHEQIQVFGKTVHLQ
jgi:DNA-binding Lrp family transcriptional regulator